jgi:hypothetical protein
MPFGDKNRLSSDVAISDVDSLRALFPAFDPDVCRIIYESNRNDFEAAVNALLEMSATLDNRANTAGQQEATAAAEIKELTVSHCLFKWYQSLHTNRVRQPVARGTTIKR